MLKKRTIGLATFFSAAGLIFPLAAQQGPAPSQPTPAQTAPGPTQPSAPSEPGAPPTVRPPVIPRRTPVPAQPPGSMPPQGPGPAVSQPGAAVVPPGTPPSPEDTPTPQAPPASPLPQRRVSPPPAISSGGMVSLNFNRADLVEIIHIIAQQLRLTYTIDPEVKGTVTINSAEPLRSEDLLPIFHQLLRMNGAVAIRTGNLYHIMPIKEGKGLARPVGQGKEDSFALQIIPVRFFSVAEMKRVLTPFLQPGAEIVENPRGNFLIVMDLPSNIQRLMEIAELIDVQVFAGTRMEIYQPKVASAEELAQEMTKIMQSFASSSPQTDSFTAQFIALPRINQLLVISHSETAWIYAKRWLDRLDVVAEGPGRRIFIYPVENGKATELADVLSQALGQPTTGRRDTTRTLQELHRSTPGGTTPTPGRGTTGSSFGSPGSFGQQSQPLGAYAAVPAPGQPPVVPSPAAPPTPTVPRPPAQTPQAQQPPPEQLRIVPDPATNSLIIYGTAQEFQNIKNILKELDALPRQVLIEAMILQVDLNDKESLGVDIEILRRARVTIFGQTFTSRGALRTLGDNLPTAPTFGSGSGLSGVFGGKDVQAIVNALMTDSRVKLISSPSVLAADNRPARIQVGSEEPIPTGTINAVVGSPGVSSSTTIQYRNTGRILTILPQVNSKGLVNLQIKAEVSARGDDVTVGQDTFPAFNTQDAETTAVVQDGETLVIGGLIGERKSKSRSGIPYLMDIPVFGRFFGTTTDETKRTELIMLITPRVIRSRDEAQSVTEEFKSKLGAVRNELERIARERAKSLPKPPPAQMPAVPEPSTKEEMPRPAPSKTPATSGATLAPTRGIVNPFTNEGPGLTPIRSAGETTETVPTPQWPSSLNTQPVTEPTPAESGDILGAKPAYALSFAHKPSAPVAPARNVIARLAQVGLNRLWAVQVAALAGKKDAEAIANTLRKNGYDAYVVTIQVGEKTWHRVRVGQLADTKAASELKNTLVSATPFKQAYVAVK